MLPPAGHEQTLRFGRGNATRRLDDLPMARNSRCVVSFNRSVRLALTNIEHELSFDNIFRIAVTLSPQVTFGNAHHPANFYLLTDEA
jgi:hypothetical protein